MRAAPPPLDGEVGEHREPGGVMAGTVVVYPRGKAWKSPPRGICCILDQKAKAPTTERQLLSATECFKGLLGNLKRILCLFVIERHVGWIEFRQRAAEM